MRPTILLLLFALIATSGYAQEEILDPIDVQLDHCLQDTTGETPPGMRQCLFYAFEAWDSELNKVYNDLMTLLEPESVAALRKSQETWLAYRDAQRHFNGAVYYEELHGSLYHVTASMYNMELVKQRVIELRQILTDLKEGSE
jgi:uncharacterized protein YecT (DUF1311 family)